MYRETGRIERADEDLHKAIALDNTYSLLFEEVIESPKVEVGNVIGNDAQSGESDETHDDEMVVSTHSDNVDHEPVFHPYIPPKPFWMTAVDAVNEYLFPKDLRPRDLGPGSTGIKALPS